MKSSIITRFVTTAILSSQAFIGTIALQELAVRHHILQSNYAAQAQEGDRDAAYIYAKAKSAIVYIEVKTEQGRKTGSGVIIESNGLMITNAHVIQGATEITVELSNGQRIQPKILSAGKSGCLDLAVLQIPNQQNLPTIALENPQSVSPGQTIFAMGFPEGIKPTSITRGIVSNLHQKRGFIQFDAALNGGNSGGALLNAQGRLIGINTLKLKEKEGMNFAIDLTRIQAFLQATRKGLSPSIGKYVNMTSGQSSELGIDRPTIEGRLKEGDHQVCGDNSPANLYTFKGKANQSIIVSMQGQSVKPFLVLLDPEGRKIGQTSLNNRSSMARLYQTLSLNGVYTLIANTQKPNQFGSYQLQAVTPALFRRGELGFGDPISPEGSPYQRYAFLGKAGHPLTLSINSTQFVPLVTILDAKEQIIWKGKLPSGKLLNFNLPSDGKYQVWVSTVQPDEAGPFSIAIEPTIPQFTATRP